MEGRGPYPRPSAEPAKVPKEVSYGRIRDQQVHHWLIIILGALLFLGLAAYPVC